MLWPTGLLYAATALLAAGAALLLASLLRPSRNLTRRGGLLLGSGAAGILAILGGFLLLPGPNPVPLEEQAVQRPVAFVLAFTDATPDAERRSGRLRPGQGNQALAGWVRDHAALCQAVFTQESVLWAVEHPGADFDPEVCPPPEDGTPVEGTPVYRMHVHDPRSPVRTLQSLACALARLRQPPSTIALVCHDAQFERARLDLRSLYGGRILGPCLGNVPYSRPGLVPPVRWAVRELALARPAEGWQRWWGAGPCVGVGLGEVTLPER